MVLSFFRSRGDDTGLDHVAQATVSMLNDARHSFDLASTVILGGADPSTVGADIEATDERINAAEQKLRSELVVHISVRGGTDIGPVLAYTLLLKKVERIGDQAKNIYDLADEGVSFVGADDAAEFNRQRQEISQLYVEAADLLMSHDVDDAHAFLDKANGIRNLCGDKVREYMHSDEPGSWAVPRAMLYRYWKRILANLSGIVTGTIEPFQNIDYLDDGHTDIVDD